MRERDLALQVAQYMQLQYPWVIYRFDLAADMKLTIGQARRHKALHPKRGYPDLFIAEARQRWHGLYIELKREGEKICLVDNCSLKSHGHIHEQRERLRELTNRGYLAGFCAGFDDLKATLDDYLS